MDFEKFKKYFHPSWHKKIQPFIESKECDDIYKFLKEQSGKGAKIAPQSTNVYRAFMETPLDTLNCVMIGVEPYNKFEGDLPIATGVLMDCSTSEKVRPMLQNFYNGVERDMYDGLNLDYIREYDVSYLSKQGVLMLNADLTVEKDKPGSHTKIWREFITYLLKHVISPLGIPVICLGFDYYEKLNIYPSTIIITKQVTSTWDTEQTFTNVNTMMEQTNNESIMWVNIDVPF